MNKENLLATPPPQPGVVPETPGEPPPPPPIISKVIWKTYFISGILGWRERAKAKKQTNLRFAVK